LYDKEQDTFKELCPQIKCRDYFNDVAYLYGKPESKFQNTDYKRYGFPTGYLPIEKFREQGGIHLMLLNTENTFLKNVETFLMPFLKEHKAAQLPEFEETEHGTLCFIPDFFWQYTYRISLLTFLIRLCNYNDMNNLPYYDQDLWKKFQKYFPKCVFHCPDEWKSEVAISGKPGKYPIEDMESYNAFTVIHDCGYLAAMGLMFPNVSADNYYADDLAEDVESSDEEEETW